MKKALIVFGTTAALLASVLVPTAGFAAAKPNDVPTDAVVTIADSKLKVKGDYYYEEKFVEDIAKQEPNDSLDEADVPPLTDSFIINSFASGENKENYTAVNAYYEEEPNDSLKKADTIPLVGSFTIHGTLSSREDEDYFFIPRPKTDKKIRVAITSKDPRAHFHVKMKTSTGGEYGIANTLLGYPNPKPTFFETTVGTKKDYHFIVRAGIYNSSLSSQEYTVHVTDITNQ